VTAKDVASPPNKRHWLGVVSKNHVMIGVSQGFAQVNHGRRAPLLRMQPGDGLVYYSPRHELGSAGTLQAFTAIGHVVGDAHQVQVSPDFAPWRRPVSYRTDVADAPIGDLKSVLHLTSEPNWGYQLRFGLIEVTATDFQLIANAMADAYVRVAK
jgi:EVE domain